MAKTVVCIVGKHADAEHIVQELVQNGFPRDEIKMVYEEHVGEDVPGDVSEADLKELHNALLEAGMPDAAARHYEEEIHHGKTMITVRASDDMADRACDIIEDEADEVEEFDAGTERFSELNAASPAPIEVEETLAVEAVEPAPIEAVEPMPIEPATPLEKARASQMGTAAAEPVASREMDSGPEPAVAEVGTGGADVVPPRSSREPAQASATKPTEEIRIPIVEERLKVGKREVEAGGVRVEPRVTETPVEENVTVRREDVKVERIPADRPATEADIQAARQGAVEMRERREEPVVEKEARVVGEMRVTKEASEQVETIHERVRKTDVNVDNELARYRNDERFRGKQWSQVEPDIQRDWEQKRPGTWERFKDLLRNAWHRV